MLQFHNSLRRTIHFTLTAALTVTLLGSVSAKDAALSFKTTKITDTIYMLSGVGGFTGGNIGLTVGEDGVAIIDDGLPTVLAALQDEIAKTTEQPIDYLINTHIHGDHIGNNHHFGAHGTRIISHENLRASLVKNGVRKDSGFEPATKETLPVLTFSDRMTIHINGDAATIIHFANAHTDGDAIVHFPGNNVIHMGDLLFNGLFPFIDVDNGGSTPGVIAALKAIVQLSNDETKIIPGHGPMATRQDVENTILMIEDSLKLVSELVADGKSDEEILAANPLSKYPQYHWGFITTERMTQQMITAARKQG